MTAFATYSDLEARLGITMDSAEQTRATALLADASDLVRQAAKQDLYPVVQSSITRPGVFGDRIWLPQRPVVSIDSVTAVFSGDNTPYTIPDNSWYKDQNELVRYQFPLGRERYFGTEGNGWLGPRFTLTITYTHGFAAAPALAKQITLEAVSRIWNNPEAVSQSNVAGAQLVYPAVGMVLTAEEEKKLSDAYRRRHYTIQGR